MNDPLTFVSQFTAKNQDELIKYLEEMDVLYTEGIPVLSDARYDYLRELAYKKFPKNPYFTTVGAPLQHNNPTSLRNVKVILPNYMGSLSKIVKDNKPITDSSSASFLLSKFLDKFKKGEFVIMDKLDGVSAALYKNTRKGNPDEMFTRGDGTTGQDISWILPFIQGVDTHVENGDHVIRGELVVSRKEFDTVKHLRANSRNMVAGLINSKTVDHSLLKLIEFVPYTVIEPHLKPSDQMRWCTTNGYNHVFFEIVPTTEKMSISKLSDILVERRRVSPYDIDGIVITHDAYHPIKTGENPKHSIAYKQLDDSADVTVLKVVWETSKNGLMKPVVHFNPIVLSGAQIQKATGFNAKFIKDNMIGPGSIIKISRSGEVIPHILGVVKQSIEPSLPDRPFSWTKTGVDIIIEDHENDEDVIIKNLVTFFTSLKVPGLSSGNIKKLYAAGFKNLMSMFDASVSDFQRVLGSKNGVNIFEAIQVLKRDPLDCSQLMYATNSFGQGFGSRKLKLILDEIPEISKDENFVPSLSRLIDISGVSYTTGVHFLEGLAKFRRFMSNHKQLMRCSHGEKINHEIDTSLDGAPENNISHPHKNKMLLQNRTILFTGFRDEELKMTIRRLGGEVVDTLTKKVNILVYKKYIETSQKIQKAKQMGNVDIMSIDDLKKMIE